MSKFDDFINSLDDQAELDVTEVVANLAKLHTEEISTSTAKINSMQTTLSERDKAIAERDAEISRAKAANWDLVNQIPTNTPEADAQARNDADGLPDASRITLDDVFEK
jgi:hypothetical protein